MFNTTESSYRNTKTCKPYICTENYDYYLFTGEMSISQNSRAMQFFDSIEVFEFFGKKKEFFKFYYRFFFIITYKLRYMYCYNYFKIDIETNTIQIAPNMYRIFLFSFYTVRLERFYNYTVQKLRFPKGRRHFTSIQPNDSI